MRDVWRRGGTAWLVGMVLAACAPGASAQAASATVRASVTVLDPVGVASPSWMRVGPDGSGGIHVDGRLDVTSRAPHVVVGRVGARRRPAPAGPVLRGAAGPVHRTVRAAGPADPGGSVTVVYTVLVLL